MRNNTQIALRLKNSEKGFALVAAIMACLILLALGTLVIALSTQDIRVSVKIVGDKRSLASVEEGIQSLCQTFDPQSPINAPATTTRADGKSNYTINYPATPPTTGPINLRRPGYDLVGGKVYGDRRYNISVTGRSTEYSTQVTIGVGLGYGPVEIDPQYQ
ncbi:MAG TPA: hypothetical protein VMT12_12680 [Syntrophales bacterium]|nr:hypothetical protein [Syntrophales bacterium]